MILHTCPTEYRAHEARTQPIYALRAALGHMRLTCISPTTLPTQVHISSLTIFLHTAVHPPVVPPGSRPAPGVSGFRLWLKCAQQKSLA